MSERETRSARLRAARIAAGFASAAAAAERFGWAYPTYAQHESGYGLGRNAKRYARAFRVSEAWLLTGEGKGPGGEAEPTDTVVRVLAILETLPEEYQARLLEDARILKLAADSLERERAGRRDRPEKDTPEDQ